MKKLSCLLIGLLVIVAAGCKVEKTSDDHYKVQAPTPEAKEAAQEAKEDTKELGRDIKEGAQEIAKTEAAQDIKEGAKQIGRGLKKGARDAAAATGTAVEEAGKEIQEHAKPGDQP